MSLSDEIAMQRLKEINSAIETAIDKKITDNGYARPIVLFNGVWQKDGNLPLDTDMHEYKNYYFGREAATITDPYQCTIARGSSGTIDTFGKSVRVEANAGYDINSTQ